MLTDPANGAMSCTLQVAGAPVDGDTCNFTCDDGYDLTGSAMRTCGSSGNWSGDDAVCTGMLHIKLAAAVVYSKVCFFIKYILVFKKL